MAADALNCSHFDGRVRVTKNLRLFGIAGVFVCFDHVASFIVNANHGTMRTTAKLGVADCIADCIWLAIPQATEWERIGDEIDAALIAVRGAFRKVLASGLDARLLRLF